MKKYFLKIAAVILAFVFIFIAGEIAARLYYCFKYHQRGSNGPSIVLNDELGWMPAPNYKYNKKRLNESGQRYYEHCTTDVNGFRMFGNPQETVKKKVFFLGDSFTFAEQVSDDKTFYGILNNILPIETFAFGCHGYGTLQEYLVLDKWLNKIKPDIIVIQFCSNDFVNNHYDSELLSKFHNNGMRRPYLTQNGIIYRNPGNFPEIRDIANKYSRLLHFIIFQIDLNKFRRNIEVKTAVNLFDEKEIPYPLYKESVDITEKLIKIIKLRTPSTTLIYAFCADYTPPYYNEFKRMSEENGIYFIDGIPQIIQSIEQKGIKVRTSDRVHWNERGHEIIAKCLAYFLKKRGN